MIEHFKNGTKTAREKMNRVVQEANKAFDVKTTQNTTSPYTSATQLYHGKVDVASSGGTFTGTMLDSTGTMVGTTSPFYQLTINGDGYEVDDNFIAMKSKADQEWYALNKGGGGSSSDRMAYVKTAPTSGTTIQCYLDTYLTGDEITVYCRVWANDGNTGDFTGWFTPNVEAGDYLWVQQITVSETLRWQSKTEFYLTEIREC